MPASRRTKKFGQHFLRDEKIINQIVEEGLMFFKSTNAKGLVEIGPGQGALTDPILNTLSSLESLERFLIVELDQEYARQWTLATEREPKVRVIAQDFIEVADSFILEKTPLVVVSNLPYSSGTAILTKLARFPHRIPAMVLMFQSEVAQRLRASPGNKSWGSLSIWIQNRWDVKTLCQVPPRAFSPPPDVNSEVVVVTPRAKARIQFDPQHEESWEKLLKVAFAHRRKMLRSGLPKDSIWTRSLEKSGIEPTLRGEALTWEQWDLWMKALVSLSPEST
jgi:16S rRNA (adenine1518-N6/adenine1519-N6)-dimethyltransferase